MESPTVTQREIEAGLRALGLPPGGGVMVHASLSSFGQVDGGADTVIAALMAVLTPDGTLMMPSFNHGAPFRKGGADFYSPLETPTTNGAIPERFWRMPGVRRSLDPTHPVAAWGRHSARYTARHHRTLTMGPQSPLGLLGAEGGFALLLGVDYHSNTFHHVVETTTGAPCLGPRTEAYPVMLPDGRRVLGRTWGYRERKCPINDYGRYAAEMAAQGAHKQTRIGGCTATLYRLEDGFAVIAGVLAKGKDGFPPCARCPIRPKRTAHTVETDWDAERQELLPESAAWGY